MASTADSISMALFCDFENVALGVRDANYEKFDIKRVLERLLLKGSIVVKKAYCDWDRYKSFKSAMHEANFELIEIPHVRQSGKNSADIRLVVDALDLCYTKSHVDTFVIISGDSDFSPLVSKLRENAKQVIGVGVKQSTSDLLIANCDEFIFYDDLVRDGQRSARRDTRDAQPSAKRSPEEEKRRREELENRRGQAIEIAVETFDALMAERGDSGKIWASMLKEAIKRRKPDFNESYFGFRAFGNLLEEAQARGLLVVGRDEKSGAYVQRSSPVAQAGAAEEVVSSSDGPALVTDADIELESAAVAEVSGADVAGKDKPEKNGRSATARKTGRSRTSTGRRTKAVADTVQADAVPVASELPVAEPVSAVPAELVQGDGAHAEDEPAARRPAKQGNARGRSGSRGRKAEGRSAEEEVKVGTEAVQPQAVLPEPADTPAAAQGHSEADAAPPARKPAARRRTRKPAASETGDEG
ncbi:NYN domain-containing protein [Thauera sp. Sel9]|uniref:NYN domain-containing protein n=1 Tax=Thauera sp. Sel9 TaxID=2974299 RepID=UPI0021E10AFC|nr:NYN domain-containing protein [Thauera sp. Sel9]MCV2216470.1 NYN domain-containing protein [Thauera sp. Sel9]